MDIFLNQHSMVHTAAVSDGEGEWFLTDQIVKGLSEEQLRTCPRPGMNSIVWLLWHTARTEDVTMNLLVAERPQVLDDEWLARLGLTRRDIGTAMTDDEVADVSQKVNIPALFAYREAVGRRTREIAQAISPEELDIITDEAHIKTLTDAGALSEEAHRVARFWHGKTKRFLFNMPASGHQFMHLSEALTTRKALDGPR
jgi:hypothetical protein